MSRPPKSISIVIVALTLYGAVLTAWSKESEATDSAYWKSVYEDNHVVAIEIKLTSEAWDSMQPTTTERSDRRARGGGPPEGGMDSNRDYAFAKADITIDGERFKDAGLRFKGNSSYRDSQDGFKRPFKVDMNRFVKGQKLQEDSFEIYSSPFAGAYPIAKSHQRILNGLLC